MEKFKFKCSECEQSISATEEEIGSQFNCPTCGEPGVVPKPKIPKKKGKLTAADNPTEKLDVDNGAIGGETADPTTPEIKPSRTKEEAIMEFSCKKCGKIFSVTESQDGRSFDCPECGTGEIVSQAETNQTVESKDDCVSGKETTSSNVESADYSEKQVSDNELSSSPSNEVNSFTAALKNSAENAKDIFENKAAPVMQDAGIKAARELSEAKEKLAPKFKGFINYLSRIIAFIADSIRDAAHHSKDSFSLFFGVSKKRKLNSSIDRARAEVGEQLTLENYGDLKLREQLETINERIKNVTSAKGDTKILAQERVGVFRRIFDGVPDSDGTSQGVMSSRQKLKSLESSYLDFEKTHRETRARIAYQSVKKLSYLLVGYFLILGAFTITGVFIKSQMKTQIVSIYDPNIKSSVGFVVSGFRLTNVEGEVSEGAESTGSCFAITHDGYLLTNRHVTESFEELQNDTRLKANAKSRGFNLEPKLWVFFAGEEFAAEIIHTDDKYDLAILKIKLDNAPYFKLSANSEFQRGEDVYALGFPGAASIALSQDELTKKNNNYDSSELIKQRFRIDEFKHTMTKGISSRIVNRDDIEWVQHNADINPGSSGGPLITDEGIVVGVNTLGNNDAHGVFFSFTMPQLKEIINNLGISVDSDSSH